jgi:enoyl-CoA hydratase/carnithine racemase
MDEEPTVVSAGPLRLERLAGVLWVTLDRPKRANALDRDIVDRFLDALDDEAAMRGVRTVVIAGNGANFCAGFDLSDLEMEDEATLIVRFLRIETLLQRLYHAPFITIACAQGNAIGAGADIFTACTYRIAEPNARFRMPGWQFGVALGTQRLRDRIGADRARDLLGATKTLSGAQALDCGLATHVAERATWREQIDGLLEAMQALSEPALEQLNALTVPDHRGTDMAALVTSMFTPPGINSRLTTYAKKARPAKSSTLT